MILTFFRKYIMPGQNKINAGLKLTAGMVLIILFFCTLFQQGC